MTPEINGVEVDMDVSQVGVSRAIGDPLKPGTIAGTSATTFKFPATNAVRAVMGGPSMQERPIGADPVLQFKKGGVVYLEQKVRPIEWTREEVRCVSVGNNAGWINDLKNIKLNELDLGESPRITQALMESTWFDEDSVLYFPVIDYGYGWDVAVNPALADIRPGLRCHRLLKKAFADLGYSIRVKGALNRVWKKFVMPCTEEVKAGQREVDINTLTLIQENPSFEDIPPNSYRDMPSTVDQVIDPGGTNVMTTYYQVPLDMSLEAFVDITIQMGSPTDTLTLQMYDFGTSSIIGAPYSMVVPQAFAITRSVSLGVADVTAGQQIGVLIGSSSTGNSMFITSCAVRFVPASIDYQADITINIAEAAPRMSAWDLLASINYSRCLAFDTDDRTKVVTISYDEDKYRPISEGRSYVGREDHSDPPIKGDPLKCKRIVFAWKEDSDDFYLSRANSSAGTRGWGGLIRDIQGGTLKEQKVEMAFAATAMFTYPGGVTIPVMRESEVRATVPGEDDRNFKRTPRLLIADGFADGTWTFDGVPLAVYPKCFFVFPGETDLNMSFAPETLYGTCGPGNVASHWGGYLRRLERSKTLSIDLILYDHEVKSIDFGTPVEVLDDFTTGWYYFTEIKQKRFDVDEPTRCELIQV